MNLQILKADLTKDYSTFFNSMNVYFEIKFHHQEFNTEIDTFDLDAKKLQDLIKKSTVVTKQTSVQSGQAPKWKDQSFTFNYQRLTKTGLRIIQNIEQDP